MKTKEEIQQRIKELEREYKEINNKYSPYSFNSDVSNILDAIEEKINTLKWVLN